MRFSADFWKSKTTMTAVLAVIGAVYAAVAGQITWNEAWAGIFLALQSAFIRDTVAKGLNGE